jgi:hypothetical protein
MRGVKDKLVGKDQILAWKNAADEPARSTSPEREYQPGL